MKCKYCGEEIRKGFYAGTEVLLSYLPFSKMGSWGWVPHYCDWPEEK